MADMCTGYSTFSEHTNFPRAESYEMLKGCSPALHRTM